MLDNVSKNTTPTAFSYYSSMSVGKSKLRTYLCDTDDPATYSNPLRNRNTVKFKNSKTTFVTTSQHSNKLSSGEINEISSKPLKKIVFNGTYPIDVPYSSRFNSN